MVFRLSFILFFHVCLASLSRLFIKGLLPHYVMTSFKPLLLLLGAGANIGQAVEKKFLNSGYRVAIAARSLQERHPSPDIWSYKIDLNKPNDVVELFSKVSKDIGIPNVVIYNGIYIPEHSLSIAKLQ